MFVIDGEATQLKWVTLDKREGRRGEEERRKTGRRTLLQSYVNEVPLATYIVEPPIRDPLR